MPHYGKFVKDIGLVGIAQILTNVRGFILLPILTKTLGAADYGIWAQLSITINFLIPLTSLGLPNALIRFLPTSKKAQDMQEQIWSSVFFTLGVSAATGLLLLFLMNPLQHVIQIPPPFIIFLSSLLVIQSLNNISSGIIQAFQEAKKLSAFIILSPVADILLVSVAVLADYGLYGAVIALLCAKLFILSLLSFLVVQKVGFLIPNFSRIKEYLHFSIPAMAGSFSYRVVQVSDQYIIGAFWGILFVGYYAPAYSLGLMLNMLTLPVGMILPPLLAKLFSQNNSLEIQKYLGYTMKYMLLLVIPATFGLSLLSKQLLEILSTREISLNAYMVVPLVAISFLFFAAQGVFVQVLYLFKKTSVIGTIWFLGALLNLGSNFIFIPKFGLLGAAFTTLLAYLFVFGATWFFSSKYLSFAIEWKTLLKSVLASLLMSLAILFFRPEGLLETGVSIVLGTLLYALLLFGMKGIGKKEIEFFAKLF